MEWGMEGQRRARWRCATDLTKPTQNKLVEREKAIFPLANGQQQEQHNDRRNLPSAHLRLPAFALAILRSFLFAVRPMCTGGVDWDLSSRRLMSRPAAVVVGWRLRRPCAPPSPSHWTPLRPSHAEACCASRVSSSSFL